MRKWITRKCEEMTGRWQPNRQTFRVPPPSTRLEIQVNWGTVIRNYQLRPNGGRDLHLGRTENTWRPHLHNRKWITWLKTSKRPDRHLTREDRQMATKHIKRCSKSYVIRELKIKTWDTTTHLLEWPRLKTLTTSTAGDDEEKEKHSFSMLEIQKW